MLKKCHRAIKDLYANELSNVPLKDFGFRFWLFVTSASFAEGCPGVCMRTRRVRSRSHAQTHASSHLYEYQREMSE